MDARLTRTALVGAAALAMALASGAALSQSTPDTSPTEPENAAPDLRTPAPSVNANLAAPPPTTPAPPTNAASPTGAAPPEPQPATNAATPPAPPPAKPTPPPGPPRPVRAPTAVLQVLDKITAETLAFEAPVGRPIRYKTLIFTVKVCETRGLDDPQPRPSAFVVIDSQAVAVPGHAPPPPKQVFSGWMFANGPALHPLQHPIYDAWLISCSAAAATS